MVFAFWVAHLVSKVRHGAGIWRTIFYLPTLAPPVAATLGFVYMFNASTGPVNRSWRSCTCRSRSGSTTRTWAKPSLTMLAMWGIGSIMVIFIAALLDVPAELHEAADLDGVTAWQRMRYITLPTVSPVLLFAAITGVIDGLQYFTQGYVAATAAGGGDAGAGAGSALGYPRGLDPVLPGLALPAGVPVLRHGLRLGDGRRDVRGRAGGHRRCCSLASRRWVYLPAVR